MFSTATILIILAVIAFSAFKVLQEYERGVTFTLGRYTGSKGPGLIFIIPFLQKIMRVDLRTVVMDVPINVFAGFSPALDVQMQLSGSGLGSVSFHPTGAPSQAPCVLVAAGTPVACRFSLPTGTSGLFRGVPGVGARFDGFLGPCVESDGSTAVPLCTYRGIGFLRVFRGTFQTP